MTLGQLCFMLASRGFAYLREQSASEGHHGYHENCDCVVVPGFEGPDGNPRVKIDGYDPEVMYENWLSCARTVGINKYADPMAGSWTDDERRAVRREVATRDWHWLYTGEVPKVTYESRAVMLDVLENRPHEEVTAKKLAPHGITPVFACNHEEYVGRNGRTQTRGLADLINGVELKTLGAEKDQDGKPKHGASTYNTINGYIKRSSKTKSNMKVLIFDNSENDDMSDTELAGHIKRSQAFRRGRIYIFGHDGNYRFIR